MILFIQSEATAGRRNFPFKLVDATDLQTEEPGLTPSCSIRKAGGSFAAASGTFTDRGNGSYDWALSQVELDTPGPLEIRITAAGAANFYGVATVIGANLHANTGGRLSTQVDGMGSAVLTTSAIAAGALTNAVFGANAISASKVNTDLDARLADAVCDEALSGHTTLGTLGAALNKLIYPTGAVVADGSNSATAFKTNLAETGTNYWMDTFLRFTGGTLIGQTHRILSYNGSTKFVTMANPFSATPTAADPFEIVNR